MLKHQSLFSVLSFNPNNYCLRDKGANLTGDCSGCVHSKSIKDECCPCNSCPRRLGYWTPSEIEPNKNVEVKCREPCRLFQKWKAYINAKYGAIIK